MLFDATFAKGSVCDITPEWLRENGIEGLLLDIDNTLTTHDNPVPAPGVEEWIASMKESGIRLMLVSNNHAPRVEPFAVRLGLAFVSEGKKPLGSGFRAARARLGLLFSALAVVGDQIFTDILGANLCGIRSIYVRPMEPEKTAFFKFKRFMERPLLPKG